MADTEFMSPEEIAARKRKPLQETIGAVPPVAPPDSMPADGSLASRVAPAPVSGAPTPQKEPSVPKVSPGSSPPPSPEVGGVDKTVANTQSEVNNILGRKPSSRKLRDAVDAYEAAAGQLKEQSADTSAIDADLAKARQAYDDKVSRNELLSLVQMVAQGFAKLAAYQYGAKSGRYIADQVNVPTVDYDKRSDRASEDYKQTSLEARDKRHSELDKADKRYQIEKDKVGSLRERIGAEESALGRETSMYGDELSAARARNSDATREKAATDRELSAEERANRAYGAKLFDNLQQEEEGLSRATNVLKDEKKSKAVNVDQLATQAGIDEARLAEIKQEAASAAETEDTVFTDEDRLVKEKTHAGILGEIRKKLEAVRARKVEADKLMRTGKMPEQGAAGTPAATEKKPTPDQVAKYKAMYPNVSDEQATQILTDRLNGR